MYQRPKKEDRNFESIEFSELRKVVDPQFNACHDELSDCFYNKREFIWRGKSYGILEKNQFDKIHGLIFLQRTLAFHAANQKQGQEKRIPEEKYNHNKNAEGQNCKRPTEAAAEEIQKLKQEKIEIQI